MQDRLVLGIPRVGRIRVKIKDEWVWLDSLPEHAVLPSPFDGSSMTLGYVENVVVLRGNPIGWLTGQNWIGTNNAYAMTHRILDALEEHELVQWGPKTREQIDADNMNFHELAFALYADIGEDSYRFTDLLKSCYGSIVQHLNPRHALKVHLYTGQGFIVRYAATSLTLYNKYTKTYTDNPNFSHPLVDPIAERLEHNLRVEATLKYNWFGRRRSLRQWRNTDWDQFEHELFADFLGRRFHFEYITKCPNVYQENFTESWTAADRKAFADWEQGKLVDARVILRLYSRHGFDAAISLLGHRNLLWTLLRPKCLRIPATADLRRINSTEGHRLFAKYLPLTNHLWSGANPRLLAKADKLCGL